MSQEEIGINKTLFTITEEAKQYCNEMIDLGGDISDPAIEDRLTQWWQSINKDMAHKLNGYGAVIKENEAREVALRGRAAELNAQAEVHGKIARGMREYACKRLMEAKVKRVDTDEFRITVAGNGGKQAIQINEGIIAEDLPPEFVVPTCEIDMVKVRSELEEYFNRLNEYRKANPSSTEEDAIENVEKPEILDFATLKPRGTHLSIK